MPTLGQILVNNALPPDLRDYNRVWDKKSVKDIMTIVEQKYPDKYKDIVKELYDIGHEVASEHGGQASINLDDFEKSPEINALMKDLERKVEAVQSDKSLDRKTRDDMVVKMMSDAVPIMTDATLADAVKRKTALGSQVASGARGNKNQMAQSIIGDMLVEDSRGKVIPIPIFHGYGEGVDPAEFWAASYGARKGEIDKQKGTARAGFFSKQMVAAAHRMRVTEQDCQTKNGVSSSFDDSDVIGTVLAKDAGDYKSGTIIDNAVFRDIQSGKANVFVRSPLTCQAKNGVCRMCAGVREKGRLAEIGDNIGISAVQALCLDEGTLVRMADGSSKPIRDIVVGDTVVGCSVAGVSKPVRVLNVYNNGPKLCYETTFRQGTGQTTTLPSVISTLDHKILSVHISRKQQEDKDIRPAAEIRTIKIPDSTSTRYYAKMASSYDDTGLHEEPMALAIGLVIGGGSFTGNIGGGITFSCYDSLLEEEFNAYLQQFDLKLMKYSDGEFRITQNSKDVRLLAKDEQEVRNALKYSLIQCDLWGKRSGDKTLPANWREWDNKSLSRLAAGLIASDGCIHIPKKGNSICISFAAKSLVLISELKELLSSRFGIFCSNPCPSIKKRPEGGYYDPVFSIAVASYASVVRFAEVIKIPGVKGPRLSDALNSQTKGTRTMEGGRCSFVAQTEVGERNTYDIEVDHPDHLFILDNDLVVSNSEPITQSQLCLAAGTKVQMADGNSLNIEDIEIGDYVLHYDTNTQEIRPVMVKNTYSNGERMCYRSVFISELNIDDFIEIVCTSDHKVMLSVRVRDEEGGEHQVVSLLPLSVQGYDISVIINDVRYLLDTQEQVGKLDTYDIEVASDDHTFLLENMMLVSNSSKHSGGVVGQTAGAVGGFDAINQLVQIPQTFKDAAAISTVDGSVAKIEDAPQGGKYIFIGTERHYIAGDKTPSVKVGETVEAGDVLSDGIPNPEMVVKYKGIGEGRKVFVDTFLDTLKKSGVKVNRRNVELLARGTINHVEVTDIDGPNGSTQGDVIEYDTVARDYQPREDSISVRTMLAKNKYLETPALHYSIGTKITPKVQKSLSDAGVADVLVNDFEPSFKPQMVRIMENLSRSDDWQTRMGGFYLGKGLYDAAQTGAESKVTGNQSFIPALAYGKTFGTVDPSKGF